MARRGHQLVLVARRTDRLHALAESLSTKAHVLPADLSAEPIVPRYPTVSRRWAWRRTFLINNAGLAGRAPVAKSVPEQQLNLVEVDVAAVVDLCSRFLPGMVERGRGAVLNVSSLAGFYPLPGQAAYGAAKAFVLSYTESLRSELRGTGVVASALCPGPVDTGFDEVAGFGVGERAATLPSFMWKSADEVARAAIDGLDAGKCPRRPGSGKSAGRGVLSLCAARAAAAAARAARHARNRIDVMANAAAHIRIIGHWRVPVAADR